MQSAIALAHALADETRWRIACLVADDALCVCELADILNLPQSTLSSHLQVMRKGGLVTAERSEKWAYYKLSAEILPVWRAMRSVADGDAAGNRVLAGDRKRAVSRLSLRGQSECKGPRKSIPPVKPARRRALSAK